MHKTSTAQLSTPSAAWQGAFWIMLSHTCFSGINAVVRHWSGGVDAGIESLPVPVIQFFQNLFGTLFLLPWILKARVGSFKIRYVGLHLTRIAASVLGIYLWYLSLKAMPIAESVALGFTGPIVSIIAASIWLKEKINLQRLLAIILSLTGAFVISRPDLALSENVHAIGLAALLPLSSALAIAISKLLTRKLTTLGETPTVLATYLLLLMAPVSLVPALYEWTTPSITHWPWLILLGALAAGAHLSFAKAYQLAEVTFLTPIGFSKFFINVLVGYLVFSELPVEKSLWIGVATIFASIFVLSYSSFRPVLLDYKISLYSWANRFRSS
ncbi:MAG TPA: DMT family transporter [Gammaproteobacteria bacterium]|nr:DMT family transporter [Gammaproteobacteria bacterium]